MKLKKFKFSINIKIILLIIPINKKMPNAWIEFVKEWALKHKVKYSEALKDPKLKEDYAKVKVAKPAKAPRAKKAKAEMAEAPAEAPEMAEMAAEAAPMKKAKKAKKVAEAK